MSDVGELEEEKVKKTKTTTKKSLTMKVLLSLWKHFKSFAGKHGNAIPCRHPIKLQEEFGCFRKPVVFMELWEDGGEGPVPHLVQWGQHGKIEWRPHSGQAVHGGHGALLGISRHLGAGFGMGDAGRYFTALTDKLAPAYTWAVYLYFWKLGRNYIRGFVRWLFSNLL